MIVWSMGPGNLRNTGRRMEGSALKIGIVTGASSGLGREFVRQVDTQEKLDEIWVIARRKERLKELAEQTKTRLRPLPLDLTEKSCIQALADLLEQEKPDIRLLINAAGFGKIGDFRQISHQDCSNMIDLNCRAVVEVTALALPYMREGARVLEISSTSAFQPFPGLNVYAASKAFLLRYSRALRWELFGSGVGVTAVCPYWIKDTEFIPLAKDTENGQAIRHFPLASKAERVVRRALRDSRLGLAVSTPGPVCTLHRITAKFIPHCIMMALWEGLRRI